MVARRNTIVKRTRKLQIARCVAVVAIYTALYGAWNFVAGQVDPTASPAFFSSGRTSTNAPACCTVLDYRGHNRRVK